MPYAAPASYDLPFQSGSDTSREAALRAAAFVGQQGLDVLHWFAARGDRGGTQKQVSAELGISRASVCARVHALERQGVLKKTTQRMDGCACYRIVEGR